jgi:hypothetical protein
MKKLNPIAKGSFLLGLIVFASACGATTREGYFDRDHHRYYHENAWHDCVERDPHCV